MPKDFGEPIPAAPFVALLAQQLERLAADDTLSGVEESTAPAVRILANRLGVSERAVYRYTHSLTSEGKPVDTFPRNRVEDLLDALDVSFADVYPEIVAAEDRPLEPDGYCASCREVVSPIDGCCPWCERATTSKLPKHMYCKREDAMRFPTVGGACWRCGGELHRDIPVASCACGCGTDIRRFDPNGRAVSYVKGHAPRSLEAQGSVPVGPFQDWLKQQLRDLDPIQALAHRTGLPRENVLDVLNGRVEEIDKERVRRALRNAGVEGQGKGMPWRPGSVRFRDLYPSHVRSKVCPDCDGPKAPHAERCRSCAAAAGSFVTPVWESSITPELIDEAKRLRDEEGLTFLAIAYRIRSRTRCTNVESIVVRLQSEFRRRGWSTARLDREAQAA